MAETRYPTTWWTRLDDGRVRCDVCPLDADSDICAPPNPDDRDGDGFMAWEDNCANDYRKFCGDYGLQTNALNLCMKKAGPSLSPACVQALVQAGKVSQAEVDRIKAQMKGR